MFERELEYFIAHQDELVSKHEGKTLVIRDDSVVEVADSPLDAYLKAKEKYELGTFMIQPCTRGVDAYTVTISSQEIFV